ncbi:24202_t:CDS:10, partial [Cetraspora pellucida]
LKEILTNIQELFMLRFESRVKNEGLESFEKIIPRNANTEIAPKAYIDALLKILLEVRNMYKDMIVSFQSEAKFNESINKAFVEIVNRNHVCKPSTSKSPELLARFCDSLLRKKYDENDFENDLENIMTIFHFVEDKDVFNKYYSKMLAKRLINRTLKSDDAEQSMINKLKEKCGFEYTRKFGQMLADISKSKDLNNKFKEYYFARADYQDNVSFLILSTMNWPLQPSLTNITIPEELEKVYENFKKFYRISHSKHKLNWLFHLTNGELKANYCNSTKTGYIFMVSTYQMGILLQYNKDISYTFEELMQKTDLDYDFLTAILKTLVQQKILKLIIGTEVGDPLSHYELDMDFKSNKYRVNLNIPIKTLSEEEEKKEEDHKVKERMLLIQRTILNTMKIRKTLNHIGLVNEVIAKVVDRYNFRPTIINIKKCIDILLEKEYIERVEGTKDMFRYVY